MTPDQVRELFSAAHDGELSGDERAGFDAALEADQALASDYASFVAALTAAKSIHSVEGPDLLRSVQMRLRKRSRGRFYKDRFAQGAPRGSVNPLAITLISLAVVAFAWVTLHVIQRLQILIPP